MERECEPLVVSELPLPQGEGGRTGGRNGGKNLLNAYLLGPVQKAQIPFQLDP